MFDNYNPPNINLSTRRKTRDSDGYHTTSIQFQSALSHDDTKMLAAAIAVCLGQWASTRDILLGKLVSNEYIPIRVRWSSSDTWNQLLQSVEFGERPFSKEHITSSLQLEYKREPFAASLQIIGANTSHESLDDTPISFQLAQDGKKLTLKAPISCFAPAVSVLCLQLVNNILSTFRLRGSEPIEAGYLPFESNLLSIDSCEPHLLPPYRHVMSWVDDRAHEHPDIPAVVYYETVDPNCPEKQMTYHELSIRSSQMAHYLVNRGATTGDKIAVCMKRDLDFHVTLLAILKAGGCYVPIDADLPDTRRKFISDDSGAKFVVVDANTDTEQIFEKEVVLRFPPYFELYKCDGRFQKEIDPDSVSYLLYTSGTTGHPKGCLLTHKGLHAAICSMGSHCVNIIPTEDRWLGLASVAFDVHLTEILTPWMLGFATASAPRSELLEDLAFGIELIRASHVCCVPSLIEATFGGLKNGIGKVKYLISGGEKITDNILDNWASRPGLILMNFYGPSEVTIGCTCRPMDEIIAKENIGRVFPGARSFVCSPDLQILPRGCIGELVIEGLLVGVGYHNRPDLTEKSFIEWPEKGCRAFRTGDLVRMLPDGTLEILGRADNQIKLRGIRIESEGISHVFRTASEKSNLGSLDAYTFLGQNSSFNSQQLVTLVAPLGGERIPMSVKKGGKFPPLLKDATLVKRLKEAVEKELAAYMIPAHVIPMKWLPISSNGKADDKLMKHFFASLDIDTLGSLTREIDRDRDEQPSEQNEGTEERIIQLIAGISPLVSKVLDINAHYFALGLDSLQLIRLSSAIYRDFSTLVSVADLIQASTVRKTAQLIKNRNFSRRSEEEHSVSDQLDKFAHEMEQEVSSVRSLSEVEHIYPTFPVQEGVLFSSLDDTTQYAQHFVFDLRESVDLAHLHDAWREAQVRLEILRATFHYGAGKLAQIVLLPEACSDTWSEHFVDESSTEQFLAHFHKKDADAILQTLRNDAHVIPPYRLNVYRNGKKSYMVLSIHHVLYDGISLPVILRTVADAYLNNLEHEKKHPLGSFLRALALPKNRNPLQFWKAYLEGVVTSVPRLPMTTRPNNITRKLSIPLSLAVRKAADFEVTLNALLCLTFGSTVAPDDAGEFILGVIRSGRTLLVSGAEYAPVPLVNVLPLRVRVGGTQGAAAREIQSAINEMQEFEGIPLGRIQNIVHAGGQLFEVIFSMHFEEDLEHRLWELVDTSADLPPDCLLACEVAANTESDSLTVNVAFRATEVQPEIIDNILTNFENSLRSWISSQRPQPKIRHSWMRPRIMRVDSPSSGASTPGVERGISEIVCEFLGIPLDRCNPSTSLLSLGLDSIKAVTLSRKFREAGYSITAGGIMRSPTIQKLKKQVSVPHGTHARESFEIPSKFPISPPKNLEIPSLHPEDRIQSYFATALQNGMLSQSVTSHGTPYTHYFTLRFDSVPDIKRLENAWSQVVSETSILRTSFHFSSDHGSWVQAVHSHVPSLFSMVVVEGDLVNSISEFLSEWKFDSEAALEKPPVRVRIFELPNGDVVQVLRIHHALYDGISIRLLLNLVQQAYSDRLHAPSTNFVDVLPILLSSERNGVAFWREYLKGFQPAIFSSGGSLPHCFSDKILCVDQTRMDKACRDLEVTFQSFGQAALWKILSQLFETSDITFGHVLSGRNVLEEENVIGPVLNTIPCRYSVRKDEKITNRVLVQKFHENFIRTLPIQNTSLRLIQQQSGISKVWDALFTYQTEGDGDIDHSFWNWLQQDTNDSGVQYGMNFELTAMNQHFRVRIAVAQGIMDRGTLQSVIEAFDFYLTGLVEMPEEAVGTVDKRLPKLFSPQSPQGTVHTHQDFEMVSENINTLKAILSECLQIPTSKINSSDSVIALGVDSITALQVSSKMRRKGFPIGSAEIIGSSSLRSLASRMDKFCNIKKEHQQHLNRDARGTNGFSSNCEANHVTRSTSNERQVLMPTPGMLWFIGASFSEGSSSHQHAFPYQVRNERIDSTQARTAWRSLVRRHILLRMAIICNDGVVKLLESEELEPNWTEITHSHIHEEILWIQQFVHDLVTQPLDPRSPPSRCFLIHLADHDYLIIGMHHFQYDAWSLPLMLADFEALYCNKTPTSVTDVEVQDVFRTSKEKQREYWRSTFPTGYVPHLVAFKAGRDLGGVESKRLTQWKRDIKVSTSALRKFQKKHNLSPHSLYLAALAQVQSKFCGFNDVTFGVWHSGRAASIPDIDLLAFPTLNILPMRVVISEGSSLKDTASQIQSDLKRRDHDIEQSSLLDIDAWVQGGGKPLCNVFVNILQNPKGIRNSADGFLRQVDVDYHPPATLTSCQPKRCEIVNLVRDDVLIDIFLDEDSVTMYLEVNPLTMNLQQLMEFSQQLEEALLSLNR